MLDKVVFTEEKLIKCRTKATYDKAVMFLELHGLENDCSPAGWEDYGAGTVLELFSHTNRTGEFSNFSAEDYDDTAEFYTLAEFKKKFEKTAEPKPVVLEGHDNIGALKNLPCALNVRGSKPEEASRPFLEVQEITTNGVSVTVSIDYKLKTVSLVEYVNSKDIRGKEWKFVGRGTSYQKGWKDILEAMEVAMDYGFNKLKGAE